MADIDRASTGPGRSNSAGVFLCRDSAKYPAIWPDPDMMTGKVSLSGQIKQVMARKGDYASHPFAIRERQMQHFRTSLDITIHER